MRNIYPHLSKFWFMNSKLVAILILLISINLESFSQTTLAIGDVSVIGFNSANPDKISIVLLKNISANTVINITDNGFTGVTTGRTGEGFLTYTAPSDQLAGTVLSWVNGQVITGTGWSSNSPTNFALNGSGDQIFIFQGNTANWSTQSGITLLWGGNFGVALNSTSSAANTVQPSALTGSSFLNLPSGTFANSYFANGSTSTTTVTISNTASNLLNTFGDGSKWVGTSAAIATFPNYTISVTPSIVSTGTLSALNTTYGTPSTTTTLNVSGSNLTNDILISSPTGYEISKNSDGITGFANSLTLSQSGGSVASTIIYVRLKADATVSSSPYSGDIVLSSTGATSINVATLSSNVSAKALTITGISANNKNYDGNTPTTLSGTPQYLGLVNNESFSVIGTATANFVNSSIGTNKTIIIAGYISPSSNYSITQPSLTANITTASLTLTNPVASNKIYDRTNSTVISGTLNGVIETENVTLSGIGTFSQSNIGTNLAVTSISTLGGTDASNYTLVQPVGLVANISPKELSIIGLSANNKTFDGTTSATLSGTPSLNGVIFEDESNVILSGTPMATFSQSTVGTNISVTVTGYSVSGSASENYSLTQPSGLSANITAARVPNISSILTATATYGVASASYFITASNSPTSFDATGLPGGLIINTSTGEISGTPTEISGSPFNVTISATNSGGTGTATLVYSINAKTLTINTPSVANKVYDRTNTASISGTLSGIIGTDDVTLNGTGTFSQVTVGNNLAVTSTSTLSGTDASKYSLIQPTGLTGEIVVKPLTASGASVSNKVYDGTSTATIIGATLNGVINPDAVTLMGGATFSSVNVADNIAINTSSLTLAGADADNYTVFPIIGLTGNITPKSIAITGLTVNNKVYDGTNTAYVLGTPTLSGVLGTDDVSILGTATATFDNKNIGSAKPVTITGYSLSGNQSSNYSIIQPSSLMANITALSLSVNNPVAQNKVFDSNTNATITGTLVGIISPDIVTFIGTGTFASSAVGNGIAVSSTSTLGGTGASNYTLTQPTGLTANITSPQFSNGNLVVVNVNSTNSVSLMEYSNSGTLQQTFSIPSTGTDALTISYTAGSEGALSRSQSGYYLGLVGYRTGTNSSATDRVIARINSSGTVNTKSAIPNSEGYTANNIRSAVFNDDGSRFWTSGTGTGGGVRTNLFEATSGSTQVSTTLTNTRAINIFNNQLFVSSASGTFQGLSAVGTGLPTSTGNTIAILSGFPTTSGPSSYGFSVNSTNTIAYVADDRATALGGIQKWTFNGTTWTLAYTLGTGVTNIGTRGLIVDWSGANPVIYATTAEASLNRIIKITDTGASSTVATLATSAANNIFRGITFSPTLAPTSVSLSVNANAGTEAGTTAITVTATTSAAVTSNQTVDLSVAGTGINAGDYTLSNSTITIPNGSTSGSVTFTIVDDMIAEATEIATLTLSNPSSGIVLGSPIVQNITITDNDNTPPTVVIDVATTSNYIDGGITVSPSGSFSVSGVLSDPSDLAKNLGIDFTIGDSESSLGDLIVSVKSNNQSIVPNTNLNLSGSGSSRNLKITPIKEGYSVINITVKDGIDSTSYSINYASSLASTNTSTTRFHTGTSDASTAQMIDNNLMIVGDDENQALRIYNRQNSGLPIKSFDFTSSLDLTDASAGVLREVDIEASAKAGNRIFWLGSHSNASNGNARPNRYRFFATDIAGSGSETTLAYVGRYDGLKTDLLAWDANNGHGLGANYLGLNASAATGVIPETANGGGFNIEGFEIAPNNTAAYICFRAPLATTTTRTKALIIPLTNFADLVSGNPTSTTATFGNPILLDLGGRAIREIKKNSNGEYLIIAGPHDGSTGIAPKDFRFYTWTGNAMDAPILKAANLTALNVDGSFESIVDVPSPLLSTSSIQVLVDNGDALYYGDGTIAKDLPQNNFKKFRSEIVNLGISALSISTISGTSFCENATVNIAFTSSEIYNTGNTFTAQLSDANGSYSNPTVIGTLTGVNTGTIIATIPMGTPAGTGYRIRIMASDLAITGEDNRINLSINPIPSAPVAQTNTQIYTGGSISLSATGCSGNYGLNWYKSADDLLVTMPVSLSVTTIYYAKCVPTNNTCTSAKSNEVTVTVLSNTQVITSVVSGNWEEVTTWDLGRIPQAGDIVIIDQNHNVILNNIGIAKELKYNSTGKLILNSASSQLKIGQ